MTTRLGTPWDPIAITRFKSRVDAFDTPIARQTLSEPQFDEFAQYAAFWIKQVKFGAGQTRRVSVEYSAKMNGPSEFGSVDYILKTGSSWKGKINSCIVTVDWTSLRGLGEPDFWGDADEPRDLKGKEIAPQTTQFTFKNLEPDFDLAILWRNSFWNYRVNGSRPPSWWEVVSGGPASDPWIEVSNLHSLLATAAEFKQFEDVSNPDEFWDVPIRGRKLQFEDSKSMLVDGKRVPLKRPLVKNDWERRVRVKDLVQALGGKFRYSEREARVYITFPKQD